MGDKAYQIAIEFRFKISENPKSYERFLEKFGGDSMESSIIKMVEKVVGNYDNSRHIFYSIISKVYPEKIKKKALDTGLVEKVSIDEF